MIILRKGDKGMLRHLGVLVGPQSTGRVWLLCMKYKSFWGESGDQTGFWMTFFFWGGGLTLRTQSLHYRGDGRLMEHP